MSDKSVLLLIAFPLWAWAIYRAYRERRRLEALVWLIVGGCVFAVLGLQMPVAAQNSLVGVAIALGLPLQWNLLRRRWKGD